MNLYPYQSDVVAKVEAGWAGASKQLIVIPTGGGKTIVFSTIAKRWTDAGKRVLILAHRDELITQAIDKLKRATGVEAGREMAESKASDHHQVVVGSIQSMIRRLDRWPSNSFGLVIVDEAHHAVSKSYLKVLNHFDSHAKVLGVTATPDRGDRKNLGQYFESLAAEVSIVDLIKDGYLSNISVKSVPLQIDISKVEKVAGDFSADQLGDAITPYLGQVAAAIKEHASFRRTLVFLPLIATSKAFVEECRSIGITAKHVDGYSEDRKEILGEFARWEFDVLGNAMLLTEGFDDPGIDCVVVLRPTQSRALYCQMIGRGTRIARGKRDLLILDFLWQFGDKHQLARPANLVCSQQAHAADTTTAIQEAGGQGEQMDLLSCAEDTRKQREEKLRKELEEKAKRKARSLDPCATMAMLGRIDFAEYEPTMPWESKPVTDGQRGVLVRAGFDPDAFVRGQASQVIDEIIKRQRLGLCSAKQAITLKRLGVDNPSEITFEEAGQIITKRKNW